MSVPTIHRCSKCKYDLTSHLEEAWFVYCNINITYPLCAECWGLTKKEKRCMQRNPPGVSDQNIEETNIFSRPSSPGPINE